MSERTIEPGIDALRRFKQGDRVAHISLGDGVVIRSTVDSVHVRYQQCTGIYDARWFELHPTWLFHRHTKPAHAQTPTVMPGAER